jgi:two-component system CheB/CheR fusion protein
MAKKKRTEPQTKSGRSSSKPGPKYREKLPEECDGSESPAANSARDGENGEPDDFPIVGIGASAGGLQPLKEFLDAFPENPGVALVIVQHLDPTRKSLAPELLAPHTSMKLCEVVDNPQVRPNSVYVIPPGKYLSISHGELHLTEPDQPRGARMAIDFFLRSLAKDIKQRSVGIIMSGAGTDGTLGIKLIKEVGGMVVVQDPNSADHDSMPRSAIDTGVVDFILEPSKIADVLLHYARHPYVRQTATIQLEEPEPEALEPVDSEVFNSILSLLRVRSKHDFRNYKWQTLVRRTRRRMCLAHLEDYGQYLEFLREHPEEIDALVNDLLISVTNFFRDEEAWEELRTQAIVPIVHECNADEPIRVWVPGCATGEEPYSIGMLLLEELAKAKKTAPIQIFASDVDKYALDFARHGVYPSSIQADVSPERLKRFFVQMNGDHHYSVGKHLRELVVFAEQNLIADPPFSKLNLICCRNVLIYLKADVQEKVIALFHFALRDSGYLFLGTAETIGRQTELFRTVNKRWHVYRRVGSASPERVEIPVTTGVPRREIRLREFAVPEAREARLAHIANQSVVDWLSPAAVLVDAKWNILYIQGNVERYLQHTQGVPKVDLLEKARRGLRVKIRGAVHQALARDEDVTTTAQVKVNDEYVAVRIAVRPIRDPKDDRKLALVVFSDDPLAGRVDQFGEKAALGGTVRPSRKGSHRGDGQADTAENDLDEHQIIQQLEQELAATRDDLQASLEQFEASSEEFKAANEEVMSINEELQSTNEELETSKEELQSLNEELSTVNNQLSTKIEELETQHADLKNLIGATNIATVCLDRESRIRWFTPAATRIFRLSETDIGRSLSDFAHDFEQDDLIELSDRVLRTLTSVADEVTSHEGQTYLRRIIPYRTSDEHIGGTVLTFVDISERKKSEMALAESEHQLRELTRSLQEQVDHQVSAIRVLHDITMASNEAKSFDAAINAALERICHFNGWVLGHAWLVSESNDLVSTRVWHYAREKEHSADRFDAWRRDNERARLPLDDEFMSEVIRSGQPKLLSDVNGLENWNRMHPARLGLKSAIAFPVVTREQVAAVLEFFSDKTITRDERFMDIMPQVGVQLGHVYERKRLEREVAVVADKEQQRMGQELHDGLSQQIAGISMLAGSLAENLKTEGSALAERAQKVVDATDDAKQQARSLAKGLMRFEIDSHGLRAALEELAERTRRNFDIVCTMEYPESAPQIDSFTATYLYSIAREAVHNAIKHAKAKRIWIRLTDGKNLKLEVRDDGIGFAMNAADEGEGLRLTRHRVGLIGGKLSIRAAEGGGTIVTCLLDRSSV